MITYYQANRVLNYNFRQTSYVVPSIMYVGLSVTNPNVTGIDFLEPTAFDYARIPYENSAGQSNWTTDGKSYVANANEILFGTPSEGWETVSYVFLADGTNPITSNILYYQALNYPVYIKADEPLKFLAGKLKISILEET